MSDATQTIRVVIDSSAAEAGANRVNAAQDRIAGRSRSVAAANDNLRGTFDRLGGSMGGAAGHGGKLGAVFENIRDRASGAAPEIANLTGTLAKMGPMAAVIGGVALAIGAVATKAIDAAAKVEMWKANLLTITGSSQKAEESYAALVNFATKTPFDLGQAVEGFTKLRTLGLQATEGALMSFGNTAAAMGKPLSQMIEAVADAATGEFERLKEFGIKSKQEGDKVKFTFGGVTTSVGKDAASIQKYLEDLGNTKFGGAMARQMDTIKGAMSNVEDSVFQAFAAIGGGALGASFKEMLKSISNGVSAATPMLAAMGNVIGSIVGAVGSVLNSLGNLWLSLHGGASAGTDLMSGLTVTFNLVAQGVEVFGNVVSATFGAFSGIVSGVLGLFSDGFSTLLNWMGVSFESGGRSWSNSIVGILRAVKSVVTAMPNLFAVAINDIMKMFRDLGSGVMAFLSGDFAKGMSFFNKQQFSGTGKALKAVGTIAVATANDVKGADAAIDRLLGKNKVKPKLDTGSLVKPKPDPKKKDKDSDAEKKAKQQADFWKALQGEVDTAKLLPLAAEDYRKELELQKILGHDIEATDKARIANLMQQARTAKFLTTALDTHNQTSRDIAEQETLLRMKLSGATEQQLGVESKVLDFRSAALKAGVDIQSDGYRASELMLRVDEMRLARIKAQNASYDEQTAKLKDMAQSGSTFGKDALRTNGSVGDRQALARDEFNKTLDSLKAALGSKDPNVKLTPAAFQAGVDKAGEDFRVTMAEIGTVFSQKMGRIADFLGNIGDMIGGKLGKFVSGAGNLAKGIGNFEQTKTDIGDQFTKAFGANSPAIKGIGKAVGGAMAGMQIGEQMAGLTKALGIKTSGTGAKIGGAIGGAAFGPIGSIVGGLAGGVIGGMFKKAKYGTAVLGGAGDPVISGRGAASKKAASGLAGSVQQGIADLASQLGGQVGKYAVSIGMYKDKYRVSTTGYNGKLGNQGKNNDKLGIVDFGKDGEAAAIAYAIQDAIKDGAITGLAPIIQKALSGLGSDAAIQFAKDWTATMDDYKSMIDPIGSAVDGIIKPLDALRATMLQVGASSEDMAKFEDYRGKKLQAALKEQVSGFQSILDDLNGDGGGVTAIVQLNSNLSKLDSFKADLAAGKTIDQDAFTELAGKIMGQAGDVYGTNTTQFQDIIGSLKGAATGGLTNATNAFNSAAGINSTSAAIADQTNAITATMSVGNDYLRQIAESIQNNNGLGNYNTGNGKEGNVNNGKLVVAY